MVRRLFKSANIEELGHLREEAERRLTGIGGQIRANVLPPLLRQLSGYDRQTLRADLLAGLTVALVTIPQAIGIALVAGLPIHAVLTTAVVGAIMCALYSSSRHLVFGPTNTISLILAGAVSSLADVPLSALEKVLLLGGLIGLIQLVAGLTRTGQLTQFISHTVIVAYTTAVGILIAVGQIGNLLGVDRALAVSLPATVRHLAASFVTFNFNHATALTGLLSLLALLILRRLRPRWPEGLLILLAAGGIGAAFRIDEWGVPLVRDLGAIAGAMPHYVGLPWGEEALMLLPKITGTAIAIAMLGMLEAVSIAKTMAAQSGQRVDPNQELIGMGVGNLAATVFGAMPGSASFVRSATNLQSGGRTGVSVVIGSLGVLLAVLAIAPLLGFIPVAALAAYLIHIALRLIKPKQILIARRSTRADATVFWITLMAALFLQLDTAIYVGIGVSLALFLQKASAPILVEHAFDAEGRLAQISAADARNHAQVSIVHVEGDLFFGAADLFQEGVRRLAEDQKIKVFILRMKNARHLDATTVMALDQLLDYLRPQGRHLLVSGVHGDVLLVLKRSGLARRIGLENIFPAEDNPTLATKKALLRAQELVGRKAELRIFYPEPAPAG